MMQSFKPIRKRLGDLLVDTNLVTSDQLSVALELQQKKSTKLGQALVELNFITDDLLQAFLGRQCGISYVSLREYGDVSPECIRVVPEYLARRWELFPVKILEGVITVAVADPFNVFAVDDLTLLSGLEVRTVIAPTLEIANYIDKYYVAHDIPDSIQGDNLLIKAANYAVSLGASEIYFNDNTLRYFFNVKYLKTVKLTDRDSSEFNKLLRAQDDSGTERTFIGHSSETISSKPLTFKLARVFYENACMLTVRDITSTPKLEELCLNANDVLLYKKHLENGGGTIVISSSPECFKSALLLALAEDIASPSAIVYYLSDDASPHENKKNIIFEPKKRLYTPAHYVFIENLQKEEYELVSAHSQNAKVAVTVAEKLPKLDNVALYVRQKLAPRLCAHCKVNYAVSRDYFLNCDFPIEVKSEEVILSRSTGCESCNFTCRAGTVLISFMSEDYDSLSVTKIREKMLEALWANALAGIISVEEVFLYK